VAGSSVQCGAPDTTRAIVDSLASAYLGVAGSGIGDLVAAGSEDTAHRVATLIADLSATLLLGGRRRRFLNLRERGHHVAPTR
jgi:hypothetical protein